MLTQADCAAIRSKLLLKQDDIIALEQKYMNFLVGVTLKAASNLYNDFGRANDLLPFWIDYAPRQRGRKPTGKSIPWSEVGEKSLSFNLVRAISQTHIAITFPGLPFGGDVRFATEDALIHFDVKMTGPNDNTDEVVVPPQQISGDGAFWDTGMLNKPFPVVGKRRSIIFQPKLPPFYVLDGTERLCLTYFLKVVYVVEDFGVQPLHYLEVVCVPNGLLMFDGLMYAQTPGLLIPGKDTKDTPEHVKRIRVRLDPLASISDGWRCQKIVLNDDEWKAVSRVPVR